MLTKKSIWDNSNCASWPKINADGRDRKKMSFRYLYLALIFKIISGTFVITVTSSLRVFADVLNFLKCKYYIIIYL